MKSSIAFVAICVTLACGRSTHAAPLTTAATIDASVEAKRYASRGVLENLDVARKRVRTVTFSFTVDDNDRIVLDRIEKAG